MQVYCRFESGVEIGRLRMVLDDFMESIRGLYSEDPLFVPPTDLIEIGQSYDSINAVLERLSRATFDYHAYLLSPEWKAKRDACIRDAGGRCQVCNSRYRLNCHHRTYERIGRELPEDLVVLCEVCHGIFHRNGRLAQPPGIAIPRRAILSLEGGKVKAR
jgi:5-methylcytosine-specific restriction endonuclease McrA